VVHHGYEEVPDRLFSAHAFEDVEIEGSDHHVAVVKEVDSTVMSRSLLTARTRPA